MGHAEREHALFSASGALRWLNCPGSILLEKDLPDTTSDAAEEGTLAHELAELKVRNYFYPQDISKRKLTFSIKKMKENELWDDEMLIHTDTYIDYIRDVSIKLPSTPYVIVEKRVDYGSYMPEGYQNDGFGTADCIMIQGNILHVIDFKYGKSPDGRVFAENNPQMLLYALGAYKAYKVLYQIEEIHLSIVQPRLPDGISAWVCTLDELLKFGEYSRERAALAVSGNADYSPGVKTCKYCRARAVCRARSDYNVKQAFAIGEMPPLITNEEVGKRLFAMQDVVKYQKDLKDYALKECLAGKEVPGWKAVEGKGKRDWTNQDDAFSKLTKSGVVAEEILWEKVPLTLAQVEKTVGKKDFNDAVGEFVKWVAGAPALAEESDKREAITNKVTAKEAFKEENQNAET